MLANFLREKLPDVEIVEYAALADVKLEVVRKADILILDIELPDGNGLDWFEELKDPPPTVILSTANSDFILHRAFKSRAQAFVHKTEEVDVLLLAIKAVQTGSGFLSPIIQRLRTKFQTDPVAFPKILSDREIEVLKLFAEGLSDAEIASYLGLKESSVIDHRKSIMRKTDTVNQAGLLRYAAKKGFTDLSD